MEKRIGFRICLSFCCLIVFAMQAFAVNVHKIVPIASDTSIKIEVHLSAGAGETFTVEGRITKETGSSVLWKGELGK